MASLGPVDPARSLPAEQIIGRARLAGADAGVTRLADLTRLDRIGLPVWQAVRPMSRALSVHQGKGATMLDAQVGALLEAVESHQAEIYDAPGPICRFDALAPEERAPRIDDFAADRGRPPCPDIPHRWVAAKRPGGGAPIHLPFELVSLDFTTAVPSRFDRASNGVATGATAAEAFQVALHEIIERDAVVEWESRGLLAAMATIIRPASLRFAWYLELRERLRDAGVSLRLYHVASITGTPVIVCELNDPGKAGAPYRTIHGRGCHSSPEIALFKAISEAVQTRATFIAGAREDLLPEDYVESREGVIPVAFGLPLPASAPGTDWNEIAPGPNGAEALVQSLERAGYDQIGLVDLGSPFGFSVVRVFVRGLGSLIRRRAPLP